MLGLPHAVVRPSYGVIGIGSKSALVPDLGVVVAAELAARIAVDGPDEITGLYSCGEDADAPNSLLSNAMMISCHQSINKDALAASHGSRQMSPA